MDDPPGDRQAQPGGTEVGIEDVPEDPKMVLVVGQQLLVLRRSRSLLQLLLCPEGDEIDEPVNQAHVRRGRLMEGPCVAKQCGRDFSAGPPDLRSGRIRREAEGQKMKDPVRGLVEDPVMDQLVHVGAGALALVVVDRPPLAEMGAGGSRQTVFQLDVGWHSVRLAARPRLPRVLRWERRQSTCRSRSIWPRRL